jgi:hypothetical protein
MRTGTFTRVAAALGAMLTITAPLAAQGNPNARTMELGLDAGATIGLGDISSVAIVLPASRARVGFFMQNSNWSIEPAAALGYTKVENQDGVFNYNLELGALYHFRRMALEGTERFTTPYVRPFVGLTGFSGGGSSDNEFSLGGGLGVKVPWRDRLATRWEANLGYGFDNDAFRLGALVGISFFVR